MRFLHLIQRSACTTATSVTRTHLQPSRIQHISSSNAPPLPEAASSPSSRASSSAAYMAAAAAAGTLYASVNVAHSDVSLSPSHSSSINESVQPPPPPPLDSFSVSSLPSLSTDPPPENPTSPNRSLFDKLAKADPNAVQTLSRMVSDPSNHKSLLDEKVLHVLIEGLATARKTGASARPIQLGILRILADLAEHNPTHPQFLDPALCHSLVPVLSEISDASAEPWTHWLQRQMSFSASPSPLEQVIKQQSNADLLLTLNEPASVDLDAGIAYHAMRCVANLAPHTPLHQAILSTPLLTPVCKLLRNIYMYHPAASSTTPAASHHYTELLRFTTIAVSALAKSAPSEVVANHAHIPIIALTNQSFDPTIQTFAAGGVRNLVRHAPADSKDSKKTDRWNIHREMIVSDVAHALSSCMQPGVSPRTKSFAIFAFADLMTSGHHKAAIMRKRLAPVNQNFARLLKDKNPVVFRSTSKCLSLIFGDTSIGNEAEKMVSADFAALLAEESGLFMNTVFRSHDIDGVKAIGAMCSRKSVAQRMLDKGLLEFTKGELRKAQGEYWEQLIAAVGRLAEWEDFRKLVSQTGLLRDILKRPCLVRDGCETARFLANMARDEDFRVEIAHNGLRLLLTCVTAKNNEEGVKQAMRALHNVALEGFSRVIVSQNGSIVPIIQTAKRADVESKRLAIGALAEISEALEHATTLVEADIISTLIRVAKEDVKVHRDVARCFAQMSLLPEVHGSLTQNGAAKWMADMIVKNGGSGPDSAEVLQYTTIGVCNLAYSPGVTRTKLTEFGIMKALNGLSKGPLHIPYVPVAAQQALKNLRDTDKPTMFPTDGIAKHRKPV